MKRPVLPFLAVLGLVCAAFACASASAGATVLCKANEELCKAANIYPEGTAIVAETKEASDRVEIATFGVTIKCPSKLEATVGAHSSSTQSLSISSWSLGNSGEWCTGIANNDCGTAKGGGLPYSAESIEGGLLVSGPKWHLHCSVAGSTYIDCTYYEEGSRPQFTAENKALRYSEYTVQHSGSACGGSVSRLSGTFKIVKPETPIYVSAGEHPPTATTEAATEVKGHSATLNGTVNPEGTATTYYFEYGPTTAYGAKIPVSAKEIGSGTSNVSVYETPSGLSAGTSYHYRVVAVGAGATVTGKDKSFETSSATALCSVEEEGSSCAEENRWVEGDELGASSGHLEITLKNSSGNPAAITCTQSQILGELAGSTGEPLALSVSKWSLLGCSYSGGAGSCSRESKHLPYEGSLAWTSGADGNLHIGNGGSGEPGWFIYCSGGSGIACTYSLEPNLTFEGGSPAQLALPETALKASGGTCGTEPKLKAATFTVEWPAYVAKVKPPPPAYDSSFGTNGSGNGQLSHPGDVELDASGNLWVVDKSNNRLQEFNSKGEYLAKFGSYGTGDGQFNRPAGVAIDPKGNIWVTDANNNRVEKFNAAGEFVLKFGSHGTANGQFDEPEGIAADSNGDIWVCDTLNGRIQEFNETGGFIRAVGSHGTGNGQFGQCTGIDIAPNGEIWAGDWEYNRVSVFSEAGEFLFRFGSTGSEDGQFKHPDAVEVDSNGNVWVGDQSNNRVEEFNQAGEYVAQFGSSGTGEGQFRLAYPMGIASDSNGTLWVTDVNNNRVQKWVP